MCTVVMLRRPGHPWPLVIAANRDEMVARAWAPPSRHWPDRPEVVAGLDREAGGTWLGVNDHGLVAGILNRVGSLGPAAGKRSRGELVLEALDHADAAEAADALSHLDPRAYRSFNLVVADAQSGFWLRNAGTDETEAVEAFDLPDGLSMLTARDLDDEESPRIRNYLQRFRDAPPPDPERGDWSAWQQLLTDRDAGREGDPMAAMTVVTDAGFETVSSSLIALAGPPASLGEKPRPPRWLFAPGRPDRTAFAPVPV